MQSAQHFLLSGNNQDRSGVGYEVVTSDPYPLANRIRVLVLADHLGYPRDQIHGVTTYFLEVLPALREVGIDVTACFLSRQHAAAHKLQAKGIHPIFVSRSKWDPRSLFDIIRHVRNGEFQVMHLHGRKALLFGRLAALYYGIPAVIHLHDASPIETATRLLQRALGVRTTLALAVSEPIRDFAMDAQAHVAIYHT